MTLTGNAPSAKDNMNSIASALNQLRTNINNGISALAADGATDSLAKVQALKAAIDPVAQAVLDSAATYTEAGSI